jgi:hypothetical protein
VQGGELVDEQPWVHGWVAGQATQPVPDGTAVLTGELDELAGELLVAGEGAGVAAGPGTALSQARAGVM